MDIKLYLGIFLAVVIADIISTLLAIPMFFGFPFERSIVSAIIVIIFYFLLARFLIKGPA